MTSPASDLWIRGPRVVRQDASGPAAICVREGRIAAVAPFDSVPEGAALLEAGGRTIVLPGLVDSHVHVNEPGRTEWEGWETASRAAAAGGITTVVDMPLNSVPATTTVAGFRAKIAAAKAASLVDFALWGGVVPGNESELEPLIDAGVVGFKCFLVHSGVDEFPDVGEADLRKAMPILARRGAVLQVHAEAPGPIAAAKRAADAAAARGEPRDPRSHATWLASRPPAAELEAIEMVLRLSRETGCAVHIVHLATHEALPALEAARRTGARVTVETCPHYLTFAAEDVPPGATEFKCAPPIRGRETRERLWGALAEGTIDLVASDHSPCPPAMKKRQAGDFFAAWGGIASLEVSLAATWTGAAARAFGIERIAAWMAAGPARLARLESRKGAIAVGRDADLVFFDPTAAQTVDGAALRHRHKLTPYAGRALQGRVERTILRGRTIYVRGEDPSGPPGRWLGPDPVGAAPSFSRSPS